MFTKITDFGASVHEAHKRLAKDITGETEKFAEKHHIEGAHRLHQQVTDTVLDAGDHVAHNHERAAASLDHVDPAQRVHNERAHGEYSHDHKALDEHAHGEHPLPPPPHPPPAAPQGYVTAESMPLPSPPLSASDHPSPTHAEDLDHAYIVTSKSSDGSAPLPPDPATPLQPMPIPSAQHHPHPAPVPVPAPVPIAVPLAAAHSSNSKPASAAPAAAHPPAAAGFPSMGAFLASLGLSEYAIAFDSNGFDVALLVELMDSNELDPELTKIGVLRGHMLKIRNGLRSCKGSLK